MKSHFLSMEVIRSKTKNKVLDFHINGTSPWFIDGIKFEIFDHLQQVPGIKGRWSQSLSHLLGS